MTLLIPEVHRFDSGVDYMEPTPQIREKMTAILHAWGEEQPEIAQAVKIKPSPERERFSVPHAVRDPLVKTET